MKVTIEIDGIRVEFSGDNVTKICSLIMGLLDQITHG